MISSTAQAKCTAYLCLKKLFRILLFDEIEYQNKSIAKRIVITVRFRKHEVAET